MTQQSQNTKLDNSTYNILAALGREADFLHSTVDEYIEDARTENKNDLLEIWNTIKQDKQKHMDLLKSCLDKEVQQGELRK
jgi:predicted house-cleaning noncanonical NTP pyrophosphatase (MazG superfamily)